ncbi:head-tail connector protein [Tardiphaga sp. 42S5]|uniref:head-tail connector protein n=1 Tax=Tardiphaga sp. 42S5 TaxID=1404799 RepID=UPI002A59BF18|nr:head-tail connector protein [Tardiphaga sp. 42S5]WPO39006.1 head-tail connector protein [Tardiphaga sp. 42S5]
MSALLLVPPASEPLSLAEARQFLRVEHADDDAVITALIAAARAHVEALTRRALLTQTWRFMLDAWPANGRFTPRIGPLKTLLVARVFDASGVAQALDVESFVADSAAHVIAAPCWALPAPGRAVAGIELDVICGFGALASEVPVDLLHALKILLAHWYDNRGLAASGGGAAMQPAGLHALTAPYRGLSL